MRRPAAPRLNKVGRHLADKRTVLKQTGEKTMSINLDNAQFRAFQALADDAKLGQDALVSIDEAGRGKGLLNEQRERLMKRIND